MVSQLFVLNSLITRAVLDCNFLVKYYQHVKDLSHIWSSPIVFRVLCPFENMQTKNNQTYEQLKKNSTLATFSHIYFFLNFVTKLPRRQFLIHAPLFSLKNGFLLPINYKYLENVSFFCKIYSHIHLILANKNYYFLGGGRGAMNPYYRPHTLARLLERSNAPSRLQF